MASSPVPMGRTWREASDLFFRRPVLWLPVLVADLAGSLLNLAQSSVVRAVALHGLAYHSVLGGTVQQKGMSPQAAQQLYTWVTAINWTTNFVRIALYVSALVMTAALVWQGPRRDAWAKSFAALKQRANGATLLVLRALAIFAFAVIADSYLGRYLNAHQSPLLHSIWFRVVLGVLLIAVEVAVLSRPALEVLVPTPSEHGIRTARGVALLLGLATVALGYAVGATSMGAMRGPADARRMIVTTVGSLITAVPYILMFIGYGVVSAKERTDRDEA